MYQTLRRYLPIVFLGVAINSSGCAKQSVLARNHSPGSQVPAALPTGSAPDQQTHLTGPGAAIANAAGAVAGGNSTATWPAANPASAPITAGAAITTGAAKTAAASTTMTPTLAAVYFAYDAALLDAASRQTLAANYSLLQKNPLLKIRIEGNCDERGSDEYNLALGERRAQIAARYLTDLGVAGDRITTISYGKEKPAVSEHKESAWAMNRRDDFVITSK